MTGPSHQGGFLAIVAAVILVVVAAMGAAMFAMVTSGTRGAADHAQSARALFLAESGIEWAAKDLFGTDDPESDCNGLSGSGPFSLPSGTFQITDSSYNTADENCSVTSRGNVGSVVRTISGVIPKSIIEGGGGGLFEDPDDFNGCQNNPRCEDGAIIFEPQSQGGSQGQSRTSANAGDLISEDWDAGESVYFVANFDWSGDPAGAVFGVTLDLGGGNERNCTVDFPSLASGCAAPSTNPLYETYDVVLFMGNSYGDEEVDRVELEVQWNGATPDWIELSKGCIGTEGHCSGAASDPTDGGNWNENP